MAAASRHEHNGAGRMQEDLLGDVAERPLPDICLAMGAHDNQIAMPPLRFPGNGRRGSAGSLIEHGACQTRCGQMQLFPDLLDGNGLGRHVNDMNRRIRRTSLAG